MKLLFMCMLLLPLASLGQLTRGIVLNEEGSTLEGASVLHNRTGQLAITTSDGSFTIYGLLSNDTLTISMSGYEMGSHTGITEGLLTIILKRRMEVLGEVIFQTGYETLPKERATGAFENIQATILNQQAGTNILSRLEGLVSSLSVDRKTNRQGISIRGLSSIQGTRAPLIVVDNFPYKGDIDNINPQDVVSVTVLKDAAAASIWGTQAGNGVIVITTRHGRYNKPLQINYNANITITPKPDLYYLRNMTPAQYVEVEEMLFSKSYRFSDTAANSKPDFTEVYEILFKKRRGELSSATAQSQLDELRKHDNRREFLKYFYRPAVNRQLGVGLDGGSDRMHYRFFTGFDYNHSNLDASYRRINLQLKNGYRISEKLELTTGLQYAQTRNFGGRPSYNDLRTGTYDLPIYTRLADDNGQALAVTADLRQAFKDTAGQGKLLDWNFYPMDDYKYIRSVNMRSDFLANGALKYRFLPDVNLQVQYQYEQQNSTNDNLYGPGSYLVRNQVNRFSSIDYTTGQVSYVIPPGAILVSNEAVLYIHQLRGQLNIDKVLGNHELNFLGGAEISQTKTHDQNTRTYGINEATGTSIQVDRVNRYPDFVTGTNSIVPGIDDMNYTLNRFVSIFANGAYSYKKKYMVTFSGRRDASNIFGLSTNDKWNPLWSAGIGWHLSKEDFYDLDFLPQLKLRATYGYSGNIDPGRAAITTVFYGSPSEFTQTPYSAPVTYSNPSLRWEKVKMINIAADFSIPNNTVSGNIDFYIKHATDLYGNTPIDYTTGIGTSIVKNVASMKGHGIDASLQFKLLNGAFKWNMTTLFNYHKDKVTDYYNSNLRANNYLSNSITAVEGHPVYSVYSYPWGGLDPQNGNPRAFINGQLSTDYNTITGNATLVTDINYHGPLFPVVSGALAHGFSWKGFFADIRLNYRFGYYYRLPSISYSNLFNNGIGDIDYGMRWQKPGDEIITQVPSMIYPNPGNRDAFYAGSSVLVSKGDHVRLHYIHTGYEFSQKMKAFSNLRLWITVTNLGIIWRADKYTIDPDYATSTIPPGRSITFGLSTNF